MTQFIFFFLVFAFVALCDGAEAWKAWEGRAWQNGSLFKTIRGRTVLRCFAFMLAVFAILWLRRPAALTHPQFWAEDGLVFFQQQVVAGYWGAIPNAYYGYVHLIPRTIAFVTSFLPVAQVPLGFGVCSLSLQALACSAFFWPCFRPILGSDWLRAACCLVVASAPVADELTGTVCNLQVFAGILSILLLTLEDLNPLVEALVTGIQVFVAMTAPATLLFAPILLFQLWARGSWRKVRPAIHLVALAVQAWFVVTFQVSKPSYRFNTLFVSTFSSGLSRCVLEPMIGRDFLSHTSAQSLFAKLAVALVVGTVLATCLAVRLRRERLRWVLGAGYFGVGTLAMALSGRGIAKEFLNLNGLEQFQGTRYFFVGAAMFIFCLAFTLDAFAQKLDPRMVAGLLLLLFAEGMIQNYRCGPVLVDFHWKEHAPAIERWIEARRRHIPAEAVSTPINPPGWAVAFPATR